MRAWLDFLTRGRLLELALALALGSAAAAFVDTVADLGIGVVAQHLGRYPFDVEGEEGLLNLFPAPYLLNFNVGSTVVVYGETLSALLAVSLVALLALLVVRRRDRELEVCPFCASQIPYESTHCAYCGSLVTPGTP